MFTDKSNPTTFFSFLLSAGTTYRIPNSAGLSISYVPQVFPNDYRNQEKQVNGQHYFIHRYSVTQALQNITAKIQVTATKLYVFITT